VITAVTKRITQRRLTAAQAAAVLQLTGPRVTKLFQANIDEFTLEELVGLLPALALAIQVVPEANTGEARYPGWRAGYRRMLVAGAARRDGMPAPPSRQGSHNV
jgi:hypothetical protein